MTREKTSSPAFLLTIGIPICILLFSILLVQSSLFAQSPDHLSIAITLDLMLTMPFLYFLCIRKQKRVSNYTAISLGIIGIFLAGIILPKENQSLVVFLKTWLLPIIEFTIFILLLLRARTFYFTFSRERALSRDMFDALKVGFNSALPSPANTLATMEAAIFYYCFSSWKTKVLKENEYSYHKKNSSTPLFLILILIILMETFAVHILLSQWKPLLATILMALSIYSAIQIFGMMRSLSKRPISIKDDHLFLRYGIMAETVIPLNSIKSIELRRRGLKFEGLVRSLSPLGEIDLFNTVITLKEPNIISSLYGIKKKYTTIAFSIDDRERFRNTILKQTSLDNDQDENN